VDWYGPQERRYDCEMISRVRYGMCLPGWALIEDIALMGVLEP